MVGAENETDHCCKQTEESEEDITMSCKSNSSAVL